MKTLDSFTTGTVRKNGTDWPVESLLQRTDDGKFQIVWGLCNGIPLSVKKYKTKREATLEFEAVKSTCESQRG